jgi:hypothetical protein
MDNPKSEKLIQLIAVEALVPYARNPKKPLSLDKFQKLCRSIKNDPEFFKARPCLINNRTGKNIVYAGNERLKAAISLGWKEVPCIIESLTEEEMQTRLVKDNVILGELDEELLLEDISLDSLKEMGIDISGIEDPESTLLEEKAEIRPYKKVHVLLSMPLETFGEIEPYLEKIKEIQEVEIEQSAN